MNLGSVLRGAGCAESCIAVVIPLKKGIQEEPLADCLYWIPISMGMTGSANSFVWITSFCQQLATRCHLTPGILDPSDPMQLVKKRYTNPF